MSIPLTTMAVAQELGVNLSKLFNLIRHGHMAPPRKNTSGDYAWLPADVRRAKQAIQKINQKKRDRETAGAGSQPAPAHAESI